MKDREEAERDSQPQSGTYSSETGGNMQSSEAEYVSGIYRSEQPHLLVRLFGRTLSTNAYVDSNLTRDEYDRYEFYRARTRSAALGDTVLDYMSYTASNILMFVTQTLRDLRARKVNFALGFLSCLILVTVCASTTTIVNQLPIVYLQLAELTAGEVDLLFRPVTDDGTAYLNYSAASKTLIEQGGMKYSYSTPRVILAVQLLTDSFCNFTSRDLLNNVSRRYSDTAYPGCQWYPSWYTASCLLNNCPNVPGDSSDSTVLTYIINSDREKTIGLGRTWGLPKLEPGECYIDDQLAAEFDVWIGEEILINVALPLLGSLFEDRFQIIENHPDYPMNPGWAIGNSLVMKLKVKAVFGDNNKFTHGRLIIIEYDDFLQMVSDSLYPNLPAEYIRSWNESSLYESANMMIVNLPPDRTDLYVDTDYERARFDLIEFASTAHYLVGFSQFTAQTDLINSLGFTQYLSMFLGLIINIVLVILSVLSIVLVYSLFVMSVEKRAKELGLFRMIGLNRIKLFFLLFTQSLFFGVPSVIIGLVISKVVVLVASYLFSGSTGRDVSSDLDMSGTVISIVLGLGVPVVSGLLPIQNALAKNVFESLNQRTEKNKAVVVKVERIKKIDFVWSFKVITAGLFLALLGFIIYFLFPLSLITLNIMLMGNIFLGILTGMLVGLAVISLNVQHLFEKAILAIVLFFEFSSVKSLVSKNLIAHRGRNRKTSIMYSISVSFIIFILVAYNSIIMQFSYGDEANNGAQMVLSCSRGISSDIAAAIEKMCSEDSNCYEGAWISDQLEDFVGAEDIFLSNIGRIVSGITRLRAITPNFFHTTFNQYLVVTGYSDLMGEEFLLHAYDRPLEYLAEPLYTRRGSEGCIFAEGYRSTLGVKKLENAVEMITYYETLETNYKEYTRINAFSFVEAAPGLRISKMGARHDTVVSYPTFLSLSNDSTKGMDDVKQYRYLMRYNDVATIFERTEFAGKLTLLVEDRGGYVWDSKLIADILGVISAAIDGVFVFMISVAMCICFFSILASMSTNIFEHTTELAILRSMGLKRTEAIRLYVEEAFIIILSSSILGIFSGTLVGWTMVTQSTLFTSLPIPMYFPFLQVFGIFVFSMIFAFFSTFIPSVYLLYFKGIVELHRILQ